MRISLHIDPPGRAKFSLKKLLLFAAFAYVAFLVREIWVPLGLALILAMVLDPVVDALETKGWPRAAAAALIFGGFLAVVLALVAFTVPVVAREAETVKGTFGKYFPDPSKQGVANSLTKLGLNKELSAQAANYYDQSKAKLQTAPNQLATVGPSMLSTLIWIVMVPIIGFYALRDFHLLLAKALILFPPEKRAGFQTTLHDVTSIFAKYLRGLATVSFANGVATGLLLMALRVPGAWFLGIYAGIAYPVPYFGAMSTLVLTGIVAFAGGGLYMMLWAVLLSLILHQFIFDQIVCPRVLGKHVGLHPILSVVAMLIGNLLLGIVGMVLAVPVAACIQMAVIAIQPKLGAELNFDETPESHPSPADPTSPEGSATHALHDAVVAAVERAEEQLS